MEILIQDIQDGTAIQDVSLAISDTFLGGSTALVFGAGIFNALIKVDLSAYAGMTTVYAKFSLYVFAIGTPAPVDIYWYRVKRSWVENEARWSEYATGSSWDVAGCEGAEDREASAQNTVPLVSVDSGWYDFDCKSSSVDLDLGGYFSINIQDKVSTDTNVVWSTEWTSLRPQFYLEYTEAAPPKNIRYLKQSDRNILNRRF